MDSAKHTDPDIRLSRDAEKWWVQIHLAVHETN
jgi:hypothetical protein